MISPAAARRSASATLLVALTAFTVPSASAQAHSTAVAPDSIRQIQEVEPRTGPPGTEVRIYTENLPLQARVRRGGRRDRHRIRGTRRRRPGGVRRSLRHRARAGGRPWDRAVVFIIFNGNFSPTGLSDPFHVTNADGLIRREGEITDEGDGCLALRDRDGYFYTLTGEVGEASAGGPGRRRGPVHRGWGLFAGRDDRGRPPRRPLRPRGQRLDARPTYGRLGTDSRPTLPRRAT